MKSNRDQTTHATQKSRTHIWNS